MDLLSTAEAAELLKCHPNTLRARVRKGLLRPVILGPKRVTFFKKQDVLALLETGRKVMPHKYPVATDAAPVVSVLSTQEDLAVLEHLLKGMPTDLGFSYMLRLEGRKRPQDLLEIISKYCSLPVVIAEDGLRLEADRLYLLPQGEDVSFPERHFRFRSGSTRKEQRPVDALLGSLSIEFRSNVVAILLRLNDDDGLQGMREVQGEGGIIIADEGIFGTGKGRMLLRDTGQFDLVLPAVRIGKALGELHSHFFRKEELASNIVRNESDIQRILILLHQRKGVDFTQYKPATIHRRVHRRMALSRCTRFSQYYKLLRQNTAEVDTLFNDLLINVTTFFRDPEVFRALSRKILPALMKDRAMNDPLRIWIPGCSGGEEVVSIAITLLEYLGDRALTTPVQIFATDLNEQSIERARLGIYKQQAVRSLSPRRLKKYFTEIDGHYQVIKSIRDMCVFARHDLIKDPPFSNLDLISCQNLLIYLEIPTQARIMRSFHYALRPDGFLILGRSETPSAGSDLFEQADARYKVYQGRPNLRRRVGLPIVSTPSVIATEAITVGRSALRSASSEMDVDREADRLLLHRFTPPCVVVNKDNEVVRFRGNTNQFLEHGPGKPTLHLLKLVRPDLVFELRTLLKRARKEKIPVNRRGIPTEREGTIQDLDLEVVPFGTEKEPFFMVIFRSATPIPLLLDHEASNGWPKDRKDRRIQLLEQELRDTREQTRSITQEFESATAELQSANEEVVSSNEELQSINEELETSKEELQSINEEFATINEELQQRNDALRESEERLRLSVTTGRIGLWDWDIVANRITWSDSLYTIHGVDQASFDPQLNGFEKLIHPDDREMMRKRIEAALHHDEPYETEFRAVRPDGEILWLFTNATVLRKNGKPVRMLGATLDITGRKQTEFKLRDRTRTLELLNQVGSRMVDDLDLEHVVQVVTDAGLNISNAEFGAFFFNVKDEERGSYMLYSLSGLPKDTFAKFPMPRNTAIFEATFSGRGPQRIDDVLKDERYGKNPPFKGMPPGHPPVRSYLAVPVVSRTGEVLGGLFYGHSRPGIFTQESEDNLIALAANAAMAIDNANLYSALQRELELQKKSQERLQMTVDIARLGVWSYDLLTKQVEMDRRCQELYGVTPADVTEDIHLKVVHPEDIPMRVSAFQRALDPKGDGRMEIEYRIYNQKDGGLRWVRLTSRVQFENDVPVRISGILQDLTEKRSAQEAVKQSEANFRMLADNIDQLAFVIGPEGRTTWFNQRWHEFTGLSLEDIRKDGGINVFYHEDRPRVMNVVTESLRTGKPWEEQFRLIRKDGEVRWFLSRCTPYRDAEGKIMRWFGTNTDITDSKKAEAAIRESEERFRLLADNMDQLAWIAAADGSSMWFNKRWEEFSGIPVTEIAARAKDELHHPDHYERVVTSLQECAARSEAWEQTFPMKRKDGEWRWFLSRAIPLKDAEARITKWFGTSTDITDRKEIEEALKAADASKDKFLATLAHELRSPLAPLRNGLELLPLLKEDEEGSEKVHAMMQRQLSHMVHLIDDLMDLSRISREIVQLRMEQVDLVAAAEQAIEAVRPIMDPLGHRFELIVDAKVLNVTGDRTRITQVMNNLLNNAVKYTPNNGQITMRLAKTGHQAVITVSDNGIGIPPEMLPHVFDMFAQVGAAQGRSGGGLGIGLHIVKRLVEMHQGSVEAISEGDGKGSTFVIKMPLSTRKKSSGGEGDRKVYDLAPRKVLVVDDNKDSAISLSSVLKALGQNTVVAHDGVEAVELAQREKPDLIFMDIGMPRMNGFEACEKIREHEWGRNMVIVAVTGWGLEQDRKRSMEAGFDHHYVKPIDRQSILKILSEQKVTT
jgi:two-component system CheB/CheR fusion protein